MILVDTSVWIELIEGRERGMKPDVIKSFATCAPVLQEVLQGLRPHPRNSLFRETLLSLPRLGDPLPLDMFLTAADIYYEGRRRGVTVRSSYDCLISAIAMNAGVAVWHRDRDYDRIASFTALKVVKRLP